MVMDQDATPPQDPAGPGSEPNPSTPDPPAQGGEPPVGPGQAPGAWQWGGQQWGGGYAGGSEWGRPWGPDPGDRPDWSGQPWGSASAGPDTGYGWGRDPWGGYSPYGPAGYRGYSQGAYPPPPPSPTDYPPTAPHRPHRLVPVAIAVGLVIAVASGVTGAGIGLALRGTPTASNPGGYSPTSGQNPSSGATQNSGGGTANAAAIAAAIDPSVVDIINTLAGGTGIAEGTGIIISSSGEILTNNHVIEGAQSITVQIDGQGPQLASKVVGWDPVDDVALVQIDSVSGLSLKVAPLGDSNSVNVGDSVVAIGNAYGRGGTPAVAAGTITGLDQSITASDGDTSENLSGMIQTDAAIVSGDSGGPLVDAAGKVVGMDTAGSTGQGTGRQGGGVQGFAVPLDAARQIASQIASGHASGSIQIGGGPYIGVVVGDATTQAGALIQAVEPNSPAAKLGLHAGDVIVSVSGSAIASSGDLTTALKTLHPGDTITLGWVDTSGQQQSGSLTLGNGPPR